MAYYGKGSSGQNLIDQTAPDMSNWSSGPSGTIVGSARATTSTPTSTTTALSPTAGTTPTTSNTTSFLTLAYTAKSTSNTLKFEFSCPCAMNAVASPGFFLFAGNTLIASFPAALINSATYSGTISFTAYAKPASTSAITYGVYYASPQGSGVFLLQNTGSTNLYNSTASAYLQIQEVIT